MKYTTPELTGGMEPFIPGRVGRREWIVADIGIAVEAVAREALDPRIRCGESTQNRIVQTRIHIDQADLVVHFVPGKARHCGDYPAPVLPIGLPTFAPCVEGKLGRDDGSVLIGDGVGRTQMIAVQIAGVVNT